MTHSEKVVKNKQTSVCVTHSVVNAALASRLPLLHPILFQSKGFLCFAFRIPNAELHPNAAPVLCRAVVPVAGIGSRKVP